jgi:hypothetical protein
VETPAPGPERSPAIYSIPQDAGQVADRDDPAVAACAQFARAIDVAATYYSDFADAIAGPDDNYAGIGVQDSNVTGRTALRQSAAAALDASAAAGTHA